MWHFCCDERARLAEWLLALRRVVPPDLTSGWLLKRGEKPIQAWKQRFCVLNQNGLPVYEDERCDKLVECCDLTSAFNVLPVTGPPEVPGAFGLDIVCMSPPAIHRVYATSESERDRWFRSVNRYVPHITTHTTPLYGGYLVKRGERVRNLKTRFFALLDGLLLYFNDVDAWKQLVADEAARAQGAQKRDFLSKAPSGVIPLRGSEIVFDVPKEEDLKAGCVFGIKTKTRT